MSIIFDYNNCIYISHQRFIKDIYKSVVTDNQLASYKLLLHLFAIQKPYKKLKTTTKLKNSDPVLPLQEDIIYVQEAYNDFYKEFIKREDILGSNDIYNDNKIALKTAEAVYSACGNCVKSAFGGNESNRCIQRLINGDMYIFPSNCRFYCYNVADIKIHLKEETYDLILLDPPWWNKYIRRKRRKSGDSYDMMYNEDLENIPLETMLNDDGLIVVWCTNSQQHLQTLENKILPKWSVKKLAKWYWLKITLKGELICDFSPPPGKQPFEQIIIASKNSNLALEETKIIVSIPSALHSHKPPLIDVLKPYLPENPKCLEIFARYLLPNWTSYGLEAIKFQNEHAYDQTLFPE